MRNPLLRPLTAALLALSFTAGAQALGPEEGPVAPLSPEAEHPETALAVLEQLARHHYVRRAIDDTLSSDTLDHYLDALDPQRAYFLEGDIAQFERYRYTLDDALRRGDLTPAFEIFNRYQTAAESQLESLLRLLEGGIETLDFSKEEYLAMDRSEEPFLASADAREDLWRRRLKASVLSLKLADKADEEIGPLLEKRYRNRLHRLKQTTAEDAFQLFMNALAASYDPHTQYFSPRTSENFNIQMSLSLEGIGAVLRVEDEYTTIASLVPAGPAEKSKQIKPSDRISAVAQGEDGEFVDVVGWRLDDVVDLIRGPAGTTVRLEVLPPDSEAGAPPRVLSLVREAVKLEEQSAQSEILEVPRGQDTYRIGVIDIPTFYIDFKALQQGDPEYKSTTRDVQRLIEGLRCEAVEASDAEDEAPCEPVDGIVIDLRNNGGGSLQEANALTGLFIEAGPTVQIRSASGRVDLFNDEDGQVAWEGPLAVLVNRLSASASEIFAGAIQDYQRGLVLGGQTFGKGTVQTLIPLNRGQLKMTQAKFYRVSGQSTQHQGVIPDIEYPEVYDRDEIGESTLDDALPWDVIRPTRYRRGPNLAPLLALLEDRHETRVETDPDFAYLEAMVERARARSARNRLSLNEVQRRLEREEDETLRLAIENRRREAKGLPVVASLEALEKDEDGALEGSEEDSTEDATIKAASALVEDLESDAASDVALPEEEENDEEDRDALLAEGAEILVDYLSLRQTAAVSAP
ncbi:MAG: carboxy terminal-processing peptidase [Pseudomonadales bacterium]